MPEPRVDIGAIQTILRVTPDGVWGSQTQGALDALITASRKSPARKPTGLSNPPAFFALVRQKLGPLNQGEVTGINRLLKAAGDAGWGLSWTAYGALSTPWHETYIPATDRRMQPVKEVGGSSRPYAPYFGRGDVQLTHRRNYEAAGKLIGVDLVNDPDKALDPDISAQVLICGLEAGLFDCDGKTIAQRLPTDRMATPAEFTLARRMVNVNDKAALIAGYASTFQQALMAGGWGPV